MKSWSLNRKYLLENDSNILEQKKRKKVILFERFFVS